MFGMGCEQIYMPLGDMYKLLFERLKSVVSWILRRWSKGLKVKQIRMSIQTCVDLALDTSTG